MVSVKVRPLNSKSPCQWQGKATGIHFFCNKRIKEKDKDSNLFF